MMDNAMYSDTMWGLHWLWMLAFAIVLVVPFWRICRRAGHPSWLGILILIPLINLAFLYFLAFSRWPAAEAGKRET
ncbi:MAG: hypothetical protein LPJ91_11500 [Pseudazoarcus pumilus]|nr:hypothetical protein [Pseudazoarcus pumilus]